jgi:hypothetical protein
MKKQQRKYGCNLLSKGPKILWRLVAQASGWMLPGKEDILLEGLTIEK